MQKVNFWVVTFSVTVNVNNQITTEVTCIRLHIARKLVFLLPVASCSSEKTFKHWLHGSILRIDTFIKNKRVEKFCCN